MLYPNSINGANRTLILLDDEVWRKMHEDYSHYIQDTEHEPIQNRA